MMSSDIASCWSLDNSSALSCLPRPRQSACRNRRHKGLIHKVSLPELCYCSMVNVTRACMHVPFHPLIYSWAAAKGCECEWKNCCCLLYLQGNSLTYFDWTAFFKLWLFLPGLMCMSLPIQWSVYEQQQRVVNVSEAVVDIYNCKATHSLTHSLTHI